MPRASRYRWNRVSEHLPTSIDLVSKTLEIYANKGVFRAFSRVLRRNRVALYRMQWHKDRFYDLVFDPAKHSLRFEVVLPKVPRPMYEAFKKLRPGVPLRSLHGKMKQFKRMAVFYDFCEVQPLIQAMCSSGFPR